MRGKDLINKVSSSSDMPAEVIKDELKDLLSHHDLSEQNLTLDQLREVVAEYLQDVFLETKQRLKQS